MTEHYEKMADDRHRLKVVSYNKDTGDHECLYGDTAMTVKVDLMTDGTMPKGMRPEELIGKLVDVDYTFPNAWIAMNPQLVDDKGPGPK